MLINAALLLAALLPGPPQVEPAKEAEFLTARADVHRAYRRFDEAVAVYRQALALAPDYPKARRGLGLVLDLQGRHAEARAEYGAGLRTAGRFDDGPLLQDLAASWVFERRFDEAQGALQEWAGRVAARGQGDVSASEMHLQLALAREDLDEAERLGIEYYGRVPSLVGPSNPDADAVLDRLSRSAVLGFRAVIAARRGRPDAARDLIAGARQHLAELTKQLAEREKQMRGAGPQTPPTAGGLANEVLPLGELAYWLGDMPEAIERLSERTVKIPRHQLLLGQACERVGEIGCARAAYSAITASTIVSIELAWARPIAERRLAALPPLR